jgi:esterase/lipase superfamily enzyme
VERLQGKPDAAPGGSDVLHRDSTIKMNDSIRWCRLQVAALLTGALLLPALLALPVKSAEAQSPDLQRTYQRFEAAKAANDLPAALKYGRVALHLTEADPSADSRDLFDLERSLAEVEARAGEDGEALRLYQRALALQEGQLGTDHPDLVPLLTALAELQIKDGDYVAADALLHRILGIETAVYGERHENVIATLHRMQELYRVSGDAQGLGRVGDQLERAQFAPRGINPPSIAPNERRYKMSDHGFATVRVFYGTNRAPSGDLKPAEFYGRQAGALQYGYLDVTIPETHKEADLETQSRWSISTYFVSEGTLRTRYILLDQITPQPRDAFLRSLQQQIKSAPSKDVFIFVHGFNTSFEDAARRTAQLAYDLDFDGTPMMFSWPSQDSATAYLVDENAVFDSGLKMATFLEDVAARSGAERIHLIAHSMGNRALLEAVKDYLFKRAPSDRSGIFGQIVFTAPDVDREYFLDSVDALRGAAVRVTLYASNNDHALQLSRTLHAAPRAGMAGSGIVTLQGMDTIDMSGVPADALGHSYFAANAGAVYDLFRLLWRGDPPPRRCGMSQQPAADKHVIWLFHANGCQGDDLLEAGVLLKRFGDRARSLALANLQALTDPAQQQQWTRILSRLDALIAPDGLSAGPAR